MTDIKNKICFSRQKSGAALVLTIVVLVILTAIVWRVSSAISQWKHRLQYTIDYQNARYAAESGIKYALATIGETDVNYVATYYHLGKLLEREGLYKDALSIYEQGMEKAKLAKDMHTYNELQSAADEI